MLLVKYMELKSYKSRMFVPVDTRKRSGRYRPYSNVDSFLKASFLKLIILFYFFLTCNLNFIFLTNLLQVCKVIGLNGVDLFSPSDVVEKRNIRKVCICIRSLSMKARSKQLNVSNIMLSFKDV